MDSTKSPERIQLWGRIIKGQKIFRQATVDCNPQDLQSALQELCHEFDLQRPIWLSKHEKEMDQFGRTSFSKEHFMEPVTFKRLEIELILPEEDRKKTRDPRMEA